ncbi:hypothetical protein [Staphylococcus hominis]
MLKKPYYTYDIEVMNEGVIIGFLNMRTGKLFMYFHQLQAITSSSYDILSYAELQVILQDGVFIGFNNKYYDRYILKAVKDNKSKHDIKLLSDNIVQGRISRDELMKHQLFSNQHIEYDVKTVVGERISLKQLECYMNLDIVEDEGLLFKEHLSQNELKKIIQYNIHDIRSTAKIFTELYKGHFEVSESLIKEFKLDQKNLSYSQGSMIDTILTNNYQFRPIDIKKPTLHYNGYNWNGVFDVETIDELLQMIDKKYENDIKGNTRQRYYNKNGIIELQTREHGSKIQPNKFKGYTIYKHGIHITISKGGAHGAIRGIYDNVTELDIASMYPSLIINDKALGQTTKKYNTIRQERLTLKHNKSNPKREKALKLVLNTVTGRMDAAFSPLHVPNTILSLRLIGQAVLLKMVELATKEGARVIAVNTDGIYCTGNFNSQSVINKIKLLFNLDLEEEKYKRVAISTTNYAVLQKEDSTIKRRGNLSNFNYRNTQVYPKAITDAVVNQLIHDIPVEQTINNNTNIWDFAQMVKVSNNSVLRDGDGQTYQRVNRIIATNNGVSGLTSTEKAKKGLKKAPNVSPDEIYTICNDMKSIQNLNHSIINKQHYINKANELVKDFT